MSLGRSGVLVQSVVDRLGLEDKYTMEVREGGIARLHEDEKRQTNVRHAISHFTLSMLDY